jgi:1-acyl-sn-glycerol-3-phosphate acyltransferase
MFKQICALILKLSGWKLVMNVPKDVRSFVFIGAPHTSNHDFVPAMAMAYVTHLNARFVIKQEWLRFPLNLFFAPLGAIGLDRKAIEASGTANTTEAMAAFFKQHKDLVLMISPEGTRSPRKNWKTGFYYIAQKARVPIALGYADYSKKEAGIGMLIYPENFENDMKTIMDFYRGIQGKNPENFHLDERFS